MYLKRIFILFFVLLIALLSLPGCGQGPPEPAREETSVAPPMTVNLSFPDGAPPLNQEAELICTVNASFMHVKNMSISIKLPEALELVSGELSWVGDVAEGDKVDVIKAIVRSVNTGNWSIEVHKYLNPEEHGGLGGNYWHPVYVSISEDSAEWGITPPWFKGGGVEVPVEKEETSN